MKNTAHWFLVLLFIGAFLLSTNAAAADLEFSVGKSQFTTIADGTWYQEPFNHTINLKSTSYSVGVASKFYGNFDWHIGYT